MEIRETDHFSSWLKSLKDMRSKARILYAITKCERASRMVGDIKAVGGVHEIRLHFGPGYRLYYAQHGKTLVWLLAGGDKSTQSRDIKLAKRLAKEFAEG
ncbi:type II toxin-antitoxin system RelE/ParE family toxin [Corynebacterium phocae]|uniref:type II toxin-antitoxin system RelE/ParE family toxin n=1 Tax=Corynebacterium phocae TaxID=161895 RepID=UPI001FEC18CB|nr:type II toxin-antitoxin system RelE/ParE family toxin [Corynebacterium phocae]